jgi:hypothetical protein
MVIIFIWITIGGSRSWRQQIGLILRRYPIVGNIFNTILGVVIALAILLSIQQLNRLVIKRRTMGLFIVAGAASGLALNAANNTSWLDVGLCLSTGIAAFFGGRVFQIDISDGADRE